MWKILSLTFLLLVSLILAAPTRNEVDTTLRIEDIYFTRAVYSGKHEIEKLLVPLNGLNYIVFNDKYPRNDFKVHLMVFFIEADIDSNGNRIDKGIYVIKDGEAIKLLEHGEDFTASIDSNKLVYFGTKDGIYIYDPESNAAEKYGTVDDSILNIVTDIKGEVIYILTEERELFKVTSGGMEKEKINDVVNAKQFMLDFSINIYFYSDDNQVYVRTADGIKKIEGLPINPSSTVQFLKPTVFPVENDAVPIVIDNFVYVAYANGTSYYSDLEFDSKLNPLTYSPDAVLVQYFAHDKHIYEMNAFENFNNAYDTELVDIIIDTDKYMRSPTLNSNSHDQYVKELWQF